MNNHITFSLLILSVIFSSSFPYVLGEIPSMDTANLRFSQNFFNIFSILPLLVMVMGGVIIFYAIYEKKIQKSGITKKIILIGSIVIFLGMVMFGIYLID